MRLNKLELLEFVAQNYQNINRLKSKELVEDFELEIPGAWNLLFTANAPAKAILYGLKRRQLTRNTSAVLPRMSTQGGSFPVPEDLQKVTLIELTCHSLNRCRAATLKHTKSRF